MSWMERRRSQRRRLTGQQLLGWANYLTYGRIASIPILMLALSWISRSEPGPSPSNVLLSWFAAILLALTGISDIIDGYLARRHGAATIFGKFIDPLADKLVTTAVLIMLIPLERLRPWIVITLICREIIVTAVRAMAAGEGIVIAASVWGKRKTAMESCALTALLIHYPFWGVDPRAVGLVLIWFTLVISVGSGAHYVWNFFKVVMTRHKKEA